VKKYLFILTLLFASILRNDFVLAQARLVFSSHTAYINTSGGSAATPIYLVIGNPANTGITGGSAANGWIISEGQYNCVEWLNTTTSTTYRIPFGYSNSDYLPFTFARDNTAGASNLIASTYYNSNANMSTGIGVPAATDGGSVPAVSNLEMAFNSSASTWGGYVNVIDRFWCVQATSPAFLSFSYRGSVANENANSITSNLLIQHWNGTCWDAGNSSCICSTTTACYTPTGTPGSVGGSDYTVTGSTICNEFSPYILTSSTNPLPIELLSFNAKCNNDVVTINWSTASETNNEYFTIERSNDGVTWVTLTTLPGAGNSNTTLYYSYTDNNPLPGTSYYRLKQTDFSGQSVTFDPVTVSCSDANSENTGITLIYPNPAVNEVFVKINCLENSNGQLIVYNTIGQKIIEQQLTLLNGENVYTIDISGFAEGIYPITFNNEQGVSCTRKIIKSKQ
jgi:hypothetical protein